ncbi:ABC transporter permease [Prolixibacter denitrificans]|uniref:Lipoprotein-releasing system permease protein n=1 Tax=Prolixibacter denitrificans TaxID=1541063 RepID=A0A2P8CGX3_9BACT|nr:ABC transporter permease [Prolixibacter denitrificans]PSK84235.1 lipoprotein-releasing system permease protein [Prolixibacter denitrificans]GET20409.1 membrane protein [Prolixibacter denitrificans]
MNLPLYIAKRYLLSRKKTNIINIISGISIVGMSVGTMALVVVLSVFNGFDGLIKSLFSSFDPDLKITVAEGKSFQDSTAVFQKIRNLPEVADYAQIIEENALLRYSNQQYIATIMGVSPSFQQMTGIDTMLVDGKFKLEDADNYYAVIGQGVAYYLSVGLNFINPIQVYVPQRGRTMGMGLVGNFNHDIIFPTGIFSIQQEIDSKYVIVPMAFARRLFEMPTGVSAVELKLKKDASVKETQQKIQELVGNRFVVKNRYQQHDYLYKIMKSEKWAVYLILVFILLIASFNIVGSLTMLILDKKEDINILKSMGANHSLIRKIFLFEGWSISIIGAVVGTSLGLVVSWLQQTYGLLKLTGGTSFIIDAYPVKIIPMDVTAIFISVLVIGFFAAWFPVRFISGKYLTNESY